VHRAARFPPDAAKPEEATNRNGTGAETVLTEDGTLCAEVPRDRVGSFEPKLIPKHERRIAAPCLIIPLDSGRNDAKGVHP
jgi:transposase-like protein